MFSGAVPWSSGPRGDTDPLLVPETTVLEFPKTVVGKSSIRSVTLRNDDSRQIPLDDLAALRVDPFREFRVSLNGTLIFQPGESREVAIEFRPARAARSEQQLEVVTGFGPAGPSSDIHVNGQGIDVPYDIGQQNGERDAAVSSSAIATEVRMQEQDRERAASEKVHDVLRRQRANAQQAVREWQAAGIEHNESVARWTLTNWLDFLGKTGGDHALHGSAQVVDWWKRSVYAGLKKGAGEGAKALLETAKKSAKVALVLEYPIFGLAISESVDLLSDFVLDKIGLKPTKPEDESDQHALAATKSVARAGVNKTNEIFDYKYRANLAVRDTASTAALQITKSESAEELDLWQHWARIEQSKLAVAKTVDLSFSDQLLRQWVLEHAATSSSANSTTNPKAWTSARNELKKKGLLTSLERTDLFIHQCRQEWGSLGLVETEQMAAELDTRRRKLEADGAQLERKDAGLVDYIVTQFETPLATFRRSLQPRVMARELGKSAYIIDDGPHSIGVLVFGSEFLLHCRVFLKPDGKGIRVDRFSYDVASPHLSGGPITGLYRFPGGEK